MILLAQLEKKLSTYIHKPIAFMSAAFILFVFEVSFFTSTTSFNLDIHSHGFQDADVGIISLLYTTGYLLACIYFPRLIDRFSSVTLMRIAVGILIFFYLIIDYLETAWLVFPIRTIWGSLTGFLFTCTIVILSELIKPKYKSTIIAILTSFVALGSALGAFLVDLTGVISLAPHLVAAMCLFLALPFFKNLYPIVSKASSVKSKNPFTTILILPVILFISLGLGVGKGTLTSFLSIYGLVAFSLSVKEAALLLSFSSMGGVFLPPLFGVLGDKMGHLKIIIFLSILAVICLGSLLIPTGIGHLYWSVFF
ncbi:MAG: MFS transporter, partial [Alphaproteobacteria bacterium]|nr:MFS transporter [Alphaproteobacteria bacterium]